MMKNKNGSTRNGEAVFYDLLRCAFHPEIITACIL